MKVVFLFMSSKSGQENHCYGDGYKYQTASPEYMRKYGDECYFKMFQSLVDENVITDLKVFFESANGIGKTDFVKGADCYVIPKISQIAEFIDDDTIIFVRGGFKHWHDFLYQYKGKNWLICYAANTGRDKWKWWDIVFDDLEMTNMVDRNTRYHFPFIKPTNEEVFHPILNKKELKYDICIGASNIHDKKGQWRTVILLEKFKELFGYYPTAVMPGAPRRSKYTTDMIHKPYFQNEIEVPGMLSKPDLALLFSKCKLFLHLGSGGQNDRSILEAAACGVPVVLANTSRFTPLLKDDGVTTFVFDMESDYEQWAFHLKKILDEYSLGQRDTRYLVYKQKMGYTEIVVPMLVKFFSILGKNKPNEFTIQRLINTFQYVQYLK